MIWITGCAGMLGRHISEKISAAGIPHISTDIEVDITDGSSVSDFISGNTIRWIINCSAYTAVDMAEDEKERAFAVNGDGVKNLAAAAKSKHAKLIHFSTDYVFPGLKESGYSEDDITGPASVYGASKLAGEYEIVSHYDRYFIFRISWLYGPYGKNFVHTILKLFNEKDEISVVNDQSGSPTCTGELADFILSLVLDDSEKYGLYHFSGEGAANWFDFASEIYALSVKYGITDKLVKISPVDSSMYPLKAVRPACSYMLKEKLISTFSYRPRHWKDELDGYIRSMKKSYNINENCNA